MYFTGNALKLPTVAISQFLGTHLFTGITLEAVALFTCHIKSKSLFMGIDLYFWKVLLKRITILVADTLYKLLLDLRVTIF